MSRLVGDNLDAKKSFEGLDALPRYTHSSRHGAGLTLAQRIPVRWALSWVPVLLLELKV
jgi:hypothetical protein